MFSPSILHVIILCGWKEKKKKKISDFFSYGIVANQTFLRKKGRTRDEWSSPDCLHLHASSRAGWPHKGMWLLL